MALLSSFVSCSLEVASYFESFINICLSARITDLHLLVNVPLVLGFILKDRAGREKHLGDLHHFSFIRRNCCLRGNVALILGRAQL